MKQLTVTLSVHERLWGLIYLALQIFLIPALLPVIDLFFDLHLSSAQLNFLFFCINFFCVVMLFRNFIWNNGKIALKKPVNIILTAIGVYYAYSISSLVVTTLINTLYPQFYNVNDSYVSSMVADDFPLMIIGTTLLVPLTEEVLYRGLIFGGLYNRSKLLAYAVSTLAFAALHVISYIGMYPSEHLLICLIEYIPAGICLGWAYAMSDSIWTPILIHTTVNSLAVFAMR